MTTPWPQGHTYATRAGRLTISAPVLVHRSKQHCWFPTLAKLNDGRVLASMSNYADVHVKRATCFQCWSGDGGRTWSSPIEATYCDVTLPRPTIGDAQVRVPYYLYPQPDGSLQSEGTLATPGENTAKPIPIRVAGWPRPISNLATTDHGTVAGFVFNGQCIELRNGRFLANLYGTFEGAKRYALVCAESADGLDWQVTSTIADEICEVEGVEGPCESAFARLKDGRILCVFRMGGFFLLAMSLSSDEGRTWTKPVQMPVAFSVQPSLAVLPDGTIALSSGRPSIYLWLNRTGDPLNWKAWDRVDILDHHNTLIPDEPIHHPHNHTSAYTEIIPLDDHHLLMIYDRIPHGWPGIPEGSSETNSCWVVRIGVDA
jgi:hypothetical protein